MLLSWPARGDDDCCGSLVPGDVAQAVDFVVVLGGEQGRGPGCWRRRRAAPVGPARWVQ